MVKHELTFAPYMLSTHDAAAYLGVSETTLRGLPIPRKMHGARRLYLRADLEAYAKAQKPKRKRSDPLRIGGPAWAIFREVVFRRDGHKCAYCGDEGGPFDIDHVIPLSKGGETVVGNLVVACRPCNNSKGAKLVEEWEGRKDDR